MKTKHIILLLIIATFAFAGCKVYVPPSSGEGTFYENGIEFNTEIKKQSFGSEKELENFLAKYKTSSYSNYGGIFSRNVMMESMALDGGATKQSADLDYSETNVQVAGIDEADIIKTDGNYIYTITDKTLYIIKAYPGEDAEIISEIEFKERPAGLFINNNSLAVFGNNQNNNIFKTLGITSSQGLSFLKIYNIEDKENPEITKEAEFEGK